MISFIQDNEGDVEVLLKLSEDSDIHDTFRVFVSFLRGITYGDSTIYNGLLQATQELEEVLEVSHGTFEDILVERELGDS